MYIVHAARDRPGSTHRRHHRHNSNLCKAHYTGPTELVVGAIGESLQPDPILGVSERIGHVEIENTKGGVGGIFWIWADRLIAKMATDKKYHGCSCDRETDLLIPTHQTDN